MKGVFVHAYSSTTTSHYASPQLRHLCNEQQTLTSRKSHKTTENEHFPNTPFYHRCSPNLLDIYSSCVVKGRFSKSTNPTLPPSQQGKTKKTPSSEPSIDKNEIEKLRNVVYRSRSTVLQTRSTLGGEGGRCRGKRQRSKIVMNFHCQKRLFSNRQNTTCLIRNVKNPCPRYLKLDRIE